MVTQEAVEQRARGRARRPHRRLGDGRDDGGSGLRVGLDEPLEALLGREGLARLGAMMAVDGEGVLRGIVTVDPVRQALRPVATRLHRR